MWAGSVAYLLLCDMNENFHAKYCPPYMKSKTAATTTTTTTNPKVEH